MESYFHKNLGLAVAEAREVVMALWEAPVIGERWVSPGSVSSKDPGVAVAVQRARGWRGKGDPAADARPDLAAIVRPFAVKGEMKRLREVMIKELLPIYAYNGPESSLVLSADRDQSLRIYIEHAEADILTNAGLAGIRIPAEERAKLADSIKEAGAWQAGEQAALDDPEDEGSRGPLSSGPVEPSAAAPGTLAAGVPGG